MIPRDRVLAALAHEVPDRVVRRDRRGRPQPDPDVGGADVEPRRGEEADGRPARAVRGVDTHHVLPHGTPEEVRREVRRVIDVLSPGGGYMLASVHTIMDDVPPENILAMVDEARAGYR